MHFSTQFSIQPDFFILFLPNCHICIFLIFFGTCRLTGTEETVRAAMKRLTQGMSDFNKAISSAKIEEEKTKIVSFCDLVDIMVWQSLFQNYVLTFLHLFTIWMFFFAEGRSADCNKDNALI
jgi:hypothetical protein